MSDENRNVRLGRLSRKESIELSKVIFSNMTKRGLSATDLAAVLEQSVTTASKKLRGLTTWSDNDLKIISGLETSLSISPISFPHKHSNPNRSTPDFNLLSLCLPISPIS